MHNEINFKLQKRKFHSHNFGYAISEILNNIYKFCILFQKFKLKKYMMHMVNMCGQHYKKHYSRLCLKIKISIKKRN